MTIVKFEVKNSICVIMRRIFWDIKFEYRFSNANRHREIANARSQIILSTLSLINVFKTLKL